MAPAYSDGPFSRVFFFYTRDGLQTFTFRSRPVVPAHSQVQVITAGDNFDAVFINTDFL